MLDKALTSVLVAINIVAFRPKGRGFRSSQLSKDPLS